MSKAIIGALVALGFMASGAFAFDSRPARPLQIENITHVQPVTGALWAAYGTSTSTAKLIYHAWWPVGTSVKVTQPLTGKTATGTVAGKPGYSIPNATAHFSKGLWTALGLMGNTGAVNFTYQILN